MIAFKLQMDKNYLLLGTKVTQRGIVHEILKCHHLPDNVSDVLEPNKDDGRHSIMSERGIWRRNTCLRVPSGPSTCDKNAYNALILVPVCSWAFRPPMKAFRPNSKADAKSTIEAT